MDNTTRPCEFCGTPLTARQKRCCGAPACKKAQLRANTRAWRTAGNVEKQETRTCNHCGGSFTTLARSDTGLCSRACVTAYNIASGAMHRASEAARVIEHRCSSCGENFMGASRATTCSRLCAYVLAHGDRSTVHWHNCKTCGKRYSAREEHRSHCSAYCKSIRKVPWRQHASHIYERDDWTCQLCMKPMSKLWDAHDPLAPTLDHIVPQSHGGGDDPSNLRAAHAYCNSARGNRVAAMA